MIFILSVGLYLISVTSPWPLHWIEVILWHEECVSVCSNFIPIEYQDNHIVGGGLTSSRVLQVRSTEPPKVAEVCGAEASESPRDIGFDLNSSTSDSWALYKRLISYFAAHKNSSNKCYTKVAALQVLTSVSVPHIDLREQIIFPLKHLTFNSKKYFIL